MVFEWMVVLIKRTKGRSEKGIWPRWPSIPLRTVCQVRKEVCRLVILLMVIAIPIFLTSCALGPNYIRPAVTVPEGYKEMEGWKVAQPGDDSSRGPWWEIFNDNQLNVLEGRVSISNQNVIVAEAQFRQARALVQAAQAGYFPTATAGASYLRSQRSANTGLNPGTSGSLSNDFLLPVNVSWELDLWGRIRRTVEAARSGAEASVADLEAVRLSSHAELAQAYFQLRILDVQRRLLDATTSAYERSLQLTRNQYASGIASRADVLQAETQLKTTRAQTIDVGVQRAQLEHAVALLTGTPASSFSIPAATPEIVPPVIPVGIPSDLLERRPDIAAAERRVAAANARVGIAITAFFPTVTLGASGGYQSTDISNWLTWPSRFWAVGPAIAETVFDGGLRSALTDEARAAYDAAVASYRQTVLIGFTEVEDNVAALRILEEEARAQDEAVIAARKSLEFSLNQYKQGTASYLNVIAAQAAALNSERVAITILGRRMAASVLLIKALGGGWKRNNIGDSFPSR
jgi:NodT family efflux transporter outer membrane factor (OMF) lipoprotein